MQDSSSSSALPSLRRNQDWGGPRAKGPSGSSLTGASSEAVQPSGPAHSYLARLDHHCVPSSQAGSRLPGEHHQGVVPGDDNATDPAVQKKRPSSLLHPAGCPPRSSHFLLSPRPAVRSRARLPDVAPKAPLGALFPGQMARDSDGFLIAAMRPVERCSLGGRGTR